METNYEKRKWTDEQVKASIEDWKKKRSELLRTGEWKIEDIPFYEPGKPPRVDLWHKVDYLDEVEIVWGKKWGASGIGRLREVAVVRPSEHDLHPIQAKDPAFTVRRPFVALDKWQKEHDGMVQVLRENGVTVHYIDYPAPPLGAYGPLKGMWAADEVTVVWGGALVPRFGGWSPLSKGRERVLTEWLARQGCPILLTIIGKGVLETGIIVSLTDDCAVIGRGMAFNQDGIDQVRPVLQRVGITELLEVHIPGWLESTVWPAGGTYHPNMFMNPVDLGKVLIYPPLCGWEAIKWLRDKGFELIEIPSDEQRDQIPSCLIILGPGKIMMHAGARETIKKVRKAGVEVIEVPYAEGLKMGGGMDCGVLKLIRDQGPKLADIK